MRILFFLSTLLCLLMNSAAATPVEDTEIVSFFVPVERLRLEMEANLPALKTQRPDLADEISRMPSRFDTHELITRMANLLKGRLSEKEKASILAFAKTPAGKTMHELLRESNPQKRKASENRTDPALFRQILDFSASPPAQKVQALLTSAEAANIQSSYGRDVMCSLLKESKPAVFEQFRTQGACTK